MYATVVIPAGYKATKARVYASNTSLSVTIYESNISTATHTSKGTGTTGAEINITDVSSSTTNYLVIYVLTTDGYWDGTTGHRVYGGYVTIAQI